MALNCTFMAIIKKDIVITKSENYEALNYLFQTNNNRTRLKWPSYFLAIFFGKLCVSAMGNISLKHISFSKPLACFREKILRRILARKMLCYLQEEDMDVKI